MLDGILCDIHVVFSVRVIVPYLLWIVRGQSKGSVASDNNAF